MIFVTVGTQLPFDRLIQTMDSWAMEHPETEVVAQIGRGALYRPTNLRCKATFGASEFRKAFSKSVLVVAHAGIGTILLARELQKPVVVLPRRSSLGEHRTDHQYATAKRFVGIGLARVAWTEGELSDRITEAQVEPSCIASASNQSRARLISQLRDFLHRHAK